MDVSRGRDFRRCGARCPRGRLVPNRHGEQRARARATLGLIKWWNWRRNWSLPGPRPETPKKMTLVTVEFLADGDESELVLTPERFPKRRNGRAL
jgi:hypothetical protein